MKEAKSIEYYDLMLKTIEFLEDKLPKIQTRLKHAEAGFIVCEQQNGKYTYSHKFKQGSKWKKRRLNSNDKQLIEDLAQKHWDRRQAWKLKRALDSAKAYVETYKSYKVGPSEDSEGFVLLWAELHGMSDYEAWGSAPYNDSRDFHPEQLIHPTGKGDEKVRSKSEVLIARALQAHGIQYHYEEVTQVGYNTYRPDFTIRHPVTGVIIIWEHFGMMDKDNYAWSAADKIRNYMKSGYSQTTNFITTFEDKAHPLDIDTIEDAINRLLLNDPVER